MPIQKRKSDVIDLDSSDVENQAPVAGPSSSKKIKERPDRDRSAPEDLLTRIMNVELDDDTVYDNCQTVRKKISDLLATNQCTQKDFLEAIGGVNSNSLRQFLSYKGPVQGSGNRTYDAAYVFFEKLRILNGKPKSAARKKAEEGLGGRGFATETRRQGAWCLPGQTYGYDALGQLQLTSGRR